MALHHPVSKIYPRYMSPAALFTPHSTPCYMLKLPALFLKVTGLAQFVPHSSVIPCWKIFSQLTSRILLKTLLETHFNRKGFILNYLFSMPYFHLVYCSYSVTFLPRDALALGGWGRAQWESVRGNFVGSVFSALALSGACGYKG